MEFLRYDETVSKLSRLVTVDFFYVLVALLSFTVIFYVISVNRNGYISKGVPTLKLGYFDLLGHLKYLPKGSLKNISFLNVYILQLISGFSMLFRQHKKFLFWIANQPFLVLHKAEAVEDILNSTTTLEKAWSYDVLHPWLGTGLLTSKGSKWKSRRKLLTPSFHFDILKEFIPVFNEQCSILTNILKKEALKDWTDLTKVVTLCSLDIICETTLGASIRAQHNSSSEYVQSVLRASEATMTRMINPLLWYDLVFYNIQVGRQFKKDLNILHTFTRNVIKRKKADLKDDDTQLAGKKRKALMDLLLTHHINNADFTEEDIREEVDTFAFEGHDTTSMGMSWTIYLLGLYPEIQKKVHEELDMILHGDCDYITQDDLKEMHYLECVIKESLRLYPSVPLFGRQANKKTVIGGHEIPEGTVCMILVYMLHRDPDVFPNPEVFDPDRFHKESAVKRHPYSYVPFSAGPRNCIGQRFAMMEMKTVVGTVLKHFNVVSEEHRDKVLVTPDLILRPQYPLKVKFSLRTV